MLKHLDSNKVRMDDGTLIGFSFNIVELNATLSKGLTRKTEMKCASTQTDEHSPVPRPTSPSVIDAVWYRSIVNNDTL